MATIINADTSDGLKFTSDTSGELQFQSGGITKMTVSSSGVSGIPTYAGTKNIIINGDMRIAQRGTSTTGLQYDNDNNFPCCDRWQFSEFGSVSYTAAFTGSQDTDVPSGQGFANSIKLACTTADTTLEADTVVLIRQAIEAQNLQHLKFGTASAEKLTLSFWVKSNLTGTFGIVFSQDDAFKYYGVEYTIGSADTWEKKTITIDGNTSDVINNDNGIGLRLQFYFAVGSNYNGGTNEQWVAYAQADDIVPNMTNNLGGSTSNYINIAGVQLEVGDTATPFEHRPYDMELARCQRYYQVIEAGVNAYSSTGITGFPFTTSMRTTPTMTFSWAGTANRVYRIDTGGTSDLTVSATVFSTNSFVSLFAASPGGWASAAGVGFRSIFVFSAEL